MAKYKYNIVKPHDMSKHEWAACRDSINILITQVNVSMYDPIVYDKKLRAIGKTWLDAYKYIKGRSEMFRVQQLDEFINANK